LTGSGSTADDLSGKHRTAATTSTVLMGWKQENWVPG